ncbi:MAG: DNA-protecting protein DprA [Clostridia bacterium]|nr:DNA-protecting protein DprA [Clostridia bacterium]
MKLSKDQFAYYLIDSIEGVSANDKRALLSLFDEPKFFVSNFFEKAAEIKDIMGENAFINISNIIDDKQKLKELYEEFLSFNVDILCCDEENYPEKLFDLAEPPFLLYYRGNIRLLDGELILFNGTRNATRYGLDMTKEFVESFVENDLIMLSGISDGIDTACVEKTLELGGKQIIVAAAGIDRISPAINNELKEDVEKTGLVISEFAPKVSPQRFHYLLRNRIFAALLDVAILIEADEESKSLGVIKVASDMGKEIFALPGNINNKFSKAPNILIANQTASALIDPKQVVEIFRDDYYFSPKKVVVLTEEEQKIIDVIGENSTHLDNICKQLGLTYSQIMSKLLMLESKKVVRRLAGNYYEIIK